MGERARRICVWVVVVAGAITSVATSMPMGLATADVRLAPGASVVVLVRLPVHGAKRSSVVLSRATVSAASVATPVTLSARLVFDNETGALPTVAAVDTAAGDSPVMTIERSSEACGGDDCAVFAALVLARTDTGADGVVVDVRLEMDVTNGSVGTLVFDVPPEARPTLLSRLCALPVCQ